MEGKVAVVTGAGSGIGKEAAARLAARGCKVVCADLNVEAAERTAADLAGEAMAVKVNVADRASVAAMVEAVVARFRRLDLLAHCAGVWQQSTLLDLDEANWDKVVDINLKGTFLMDQACARQMLKQGEGAIVNLASVAGRNGGNFAGAHYSASKGGVIALTMQVAREIARQGVRVNCVAPGPTDSPMIATWPKEVTDGLKERSPLGRLGLPGDIAAVIVFLLSDEARFIVGETIEVNGGLFTH